MNRPPKDRKCIGQWPALNGGRNFNRFFSPGSFVRPGFSRFRNKAGNRLTDRQAKQRGRRGLVNDAEPLIRKLSRKDKHLNERSCNPRTACRQGS